MFSNQFALLIGQTSVISTVDIKLNSKWSIVWSVVPQGHIGVSLILNRCKYDLLLPCPVTMVVKFWLTFIFIFNL